MTVTRASYGRADGGQTVESVTDRRSSDDAAGVAPADREGAVAVAVPTDGGASDAPRRRDDTRGRILAAAMQMFSDRGYDKTSLREIADAVGVTKAALYYHFRTKDDIVRAALEDYTRAMVELVDRAENAAGGRNRTAELVDGLLDLFTTTGGTALRFGQANPTVMSQLHVGETHLEQVKRLVRILGGDDASAEGSIRSTLAFAALAIGAIGGDLPMAGTPDERVDAARTVALELLAPLDTAECCRGQ